MSKLLKALLHKVKIGKPYTKEELAKIAFENKIIDNEERDHLIRTALQQLSDKEKRDEILKAAQFPEGYVLIHSESSLTIKDPARQSSIEVRRNESVPYKKAIGQYLWHWLYDEPNDPTNKKVTNNFDYKVPLAQLHWDSKKDHLIQDNLVRKRKVFRSKLVTEIVVDAGSTNISVTESFLRFNDFPLNTIYCGNDHLAKPAFTTNCVEIGYKLSSFQNPSDPKQINLIVRMIGGTNRIDRSSICGELSMRYLAACQADGTIGVFDLAIIGTTGYAENINGVDYFGCDDPLESQIKSKMQDMAQMKIIPLDSTKLTYGRAISCFSPIKQSSVDLIVTDDRPFKKDKKDPERVLFDRFIKGALNSGVGVITVDSDCVE